MRRYLKIADSTLHGHHDVRFAAEPGCLNDDIFWTDEDIAEYGYRVVNVTEVEPPDVELPYRLGGYFFDESVPGELVQTWEIIAPTLDQAKSFALGRLNAEFDASLQPVEYDGKLWRPGHSSGAVIRDAAQLAEHAGIADITLTDAGYNAHTYTTADALNVSAAISLAYQALFLQRNDLRKLIVDATTVEAALAVVWNAPAAE